MIWTKKRNHGASHYNANYMSLHAHVHSVIKGELSVVFEHLTVVKKYIVSKALAFVFELVCGVFHSEWIGYDSFAIDSLELVVD